MSVEFTDGVSLMQGDCLERMKEIADGSVDMILIDPPFGTTDATWDKVVDIPMMWEQLNRIIKTNGAILIFSQLPFSCDLINANRKLFRYEWIWDKRAPRGFLNAKKMPLRVHESVLVFYKKLPIYNPQMRPGKPYRHPETKAVSYVYGKKEAPAHGSENGDRYPVDIVTFSNANSKGNGFAVHKPVPLLEYLIKTYTNPGAVVLDCFMGSGSTGVAAVNTGRKFIGIELDPGFYETAKSRIEKAIEEKTEAAHEAVF